MAYDPWDDPQAHSHLGRDARDAGIAIAESRAGAEQDRLVIAQAIRTLAGTGEEFSANDVRALLPVVAGPLIGAGFLAASKSGLIERTGSTLASHEEGHARRMSTWIKAGSNPVATTKQAGSNLLTGDGKVPSFPVLTTEQEATIREAHWALETRGRGKSGVHTTTDACKVIRGLLDVLGGLTGVTSSNDALM